MDCIEKIKSKSAAERIAKHNLVFLSPVDDPLKGIPIGDGSTGCLIWPEKDRLIFSVNNTDLWDTVSSDEIHNWNLEEEENSHALRNAGRIELRFNQPVLDLIYQSDYKAVLSLKDATYTLDSVTPFSHLMAKAYASNKSKCTVISVKADFSEDNPVEAVLENWGSRTFGHWYAQVRRDPAAGIGNTASFVDDSCIYVTRRLRTGAFCTGIFIKSDCDFVNRRQNSHSAVSTFSKRKHIKFDIVLTVALGEDEEEAKLTAQNRLNNTVKDLKFAYYEHCADWSDFWNSSYTELQDDYIENLWYLNSYYGKSEMLGALPPHFCNGIWGFNHDYVPWNHFFHWNMQLQYWAHFSAGHPELVKVYLDFRYKQLPFAIKTAKKYRGVDGALYTDVSGANAACDANTTDNLTPGSQIANFFWDYYLYTGDYDYLLKKGFPVIYNAAMLYANTVKKGEDGYYHLYRSQAYEGSPIMDDVITDRSAMSMVFDDAVKCMNLLIHNGDLLPEYDKREFISEIANNLAPIKIIPLEKDEYEVINGKKYIKSGVGKGRLIEKDFVPVTGIFCGEERGPEEAALEDSAYWSTVKKGELIRSTFSTEKRKPYYGFPDPEYSAVFPNNNIGLKDKDSDLFCAMVNLMNMKQPFALHDKEQVTFSEKESVPYCGWSLDPIVLARLGMADDLKPRLENAIEAWQWYPNGMGHYGPYDNMLKESNLRFYSHNVKDCDNPQNRFSIPAWQFRHFDLEMLPITAMAVNEMQLQSYDGVIRVFPACVKNHTGSFKLKAANSVTVYAQMTEGEADYIYIESEKENALSLVNPWKYLPKAYSKDYSEFNLREKTANNDNLLCFELGKNSGVLILSDSYTPDNIYIHDISASENTECKRFGKSRLGIERMF